MLVRYVFLSGRVVELPTGGHNRKLNGGAMFVMDVFDGDSSQLWSVFLPDDDQLAGQVADGDMVAVVGYVDENRERFDEMEGPLMAESILAMNSDGFAFGRIGE